MSDHGHDNPFIQHHYDDAKHQFDSGKLGIWAFLAQEVLFFSALFVAYILYRANHPEIFYYAHKYLDTTMGAINTGVLIFSSLTAAWAVRAAQLRQKNLLVTLLALTWLCGCGFMAIKYFEYSHKIHDGILFGEKFDPKYDPDGIYFEDTKPDAPAAAPSDEGVGPIGEDASGKPVARKPPPNTGMFFTIYFAMTGLHGIHVLVGIGIFIWLMIRAMKDQFGPEYFGPIDYAALYWHLVDLIWIFLFPLLYLIH